MRFAMTMDRTMSAIYFLFYSQSFVPTDEAETRSTVIDI